MRDDGIVGRYGSGRAVARIEDEALLKGNGRFVDDVSLPEQTHMRFLRSPHAHARILSIDAEAAKAMPGVIAVFTGADLAAAGVKPLPRAVPFKRPDGSPSTAPLRPGLAVDTVRFVGEAIAAVVAETPDQAKDAAEAIEVEFEELPFVTSARDALADNAPVVWEDAPDNISARTHFGDAAAVAEAFAKASHVVSVDVVNQRLAPTPLEPRGVLASWDGDTDRLTVRLASQMPSAARDALSHVLGLPKEQIRCVVGDVGGGFGMKTGLYAEDLTVAFAAWTLKRPVRWTAERMEEFLAATHGRDVESHAELALDAAGKVLAYRIRGVANVGAYAGAVGTLIQLMIGPWVSTSIYDIRTIDFQFDAVLTHTTTVAAYRGAGRPEAIFLIERLFDVAAQTMGLDPAEIRRRNMISPEQMPYTNAMGQTYDSGKFEQVLDQGLALARWDEFDRRAAQSKARGKLRGRGLASFLEWTGGGVFEESVTVTVSADEIEVFAATMPMGQGIATSYAQLVVDVFDVPIEKVRIVQGDTDRGSGAGSVGSRSLFTGGSAIDVASKKTIELGRERAAQELEAEVSEVEYSDGRFQVAGRNRQIGLFELAGMQPEGRIHIASTSSVDGPSWPNGCHVVEVEIDPETGVVDVVSYVSSNDVGKAVNPMIVLGQLDGGAVQGLGQALCEGMVYDEESGQPLTASFMDYAMPRFDIVEGFRHELDQSTPCLNNPLGVKGVGELGTIGATPAAVNAVLDALIRAGKSEAARTLQMPLTPLKVWRALQ